MKPPRKNPVMPKTNCSDPSRARGDEFMQADKIRAMLNRLADEYGDERVWSKPLEQQVLEVDTGIAELE